MRTTPKQMVVGVGVSATSYHDTADAIREWVEEQREIPSRPARYICVTSVHGIITAREAPAFRDILNDADIVTPDGMPVVWAMRSFGVRNQERVYGPDLMLALCQQAAEFGHRVFLYGARPETLESLQATLVRRCPGLQIVGLISPPFRPLTPAEDLVYVRKIQESRADLVFVGLSTPKQERWMQSHRLSLPGTILVGVGAAFDFHAGRIRQAQGWIRRAGLEWLFRLLMEPRRLWKRYLLTTPKFLPLWALQRVGVLRYSPPAERIIPAGEELLPQVRSTKD